MDYRWLTKNNPKGDIEIKFTGLRAGEKLYEELLIDGNFVSTENKLIMRAEEEMMSWDKLEPILAQIKEAAMNAETEKIYKILTQLVPQFSPKSHGFDLLRDKSDIQKIVYITLLAVNSKVISKMIGSL